MTNEFKILFALACVSISACATSFSSIPRISEAETSKFITKITTVSDDDLKVVDAVYGILSGRIARPVTEWIQPLNKSDKCLVYFGGMDPWWKNTGFKVYWDGECHQGYAYGTGREFVHSDGELMSSLATYKAGQTPPSSFMDVYYDRNEVVYKGNFESSISTRYYNYANISGTKRVTVVDFIVDDNEKRIYKQSHAIGADVFISEISLPNGVIYNRSININPKNNTTTWAVVDPSGNPLGYAVQSSRNPMNSSVLHVKHVPNSTTPKHIQLPENFLTHLASVFDRIDRKFNRFENSLEEAMVAINKYTRRICKGDVGVSYVDDDIYGQICLEHGELSPFQNVIARSIKEQKIRHQNEREYIDRQLAQRTRNQQIAAAQLKQQTDNFSQSMRQFTIDTRQMMNSWQAPQLMNFGQNRQSTSTCTKAGITVRCTTTY